MREQRLRKSSSLVLALDLAIPNRRKLASKAKRMVTELSTYICALKLNKQFVLKLGLSPAIEAIIDHAHSKELPVIVDEKLNDVGHTNAAVTELHFSAGFDAIIANPFVGWTDGLEPVFKIAKQRKKGVLLLVYMSHSGAKEGFGQIVEDPVSGERKFQYEVFALKTNIWKADGVIVGAPYPDIIKRVRKLLDPRIPIFSPGIGTQGGSILEAISAGAHYLIVGRSIYTSANPSASIKRLLRTISMAAV